MKLNIKENIEKDYTFKKKVLDEAIELFGENENYTDTDLEIYLMISFLDNLTEGNQLLMLLSKEDDLLSLLQNDIEPLFKTLVVDDEKMIYDILLQQYKDFVARKMQNDRSGVVIINRILKDLSQLSVDDIVEKLSPILQNLGIETKEIKNKVKSLQKNTMSDEDTLKAVKDDLENAKMKALIEKYSREEAK